MKIVKYDPKKPMELPRKVRRELGLKDPEYAVNVDLVRKMNEAIDYEYIMDYKKFHYTTWITSEEKTLKFRMGKCIQRLHDIQMICSPHDALVLFELLNVMYNYIRVTNHNRVVELKEEIKDE